jgi:hypothetical protein
VDELQEMRLGVFPTPHPYVWYIVGFGASIWVTRYSTWPLSIWTWPFLANSGQLPRRVVNLYKIRKTYSTYHPESNDISLNPIILEILWPRKLYPHLLVLKTELMHFDLSWNFSRKKEFLFNFYQHFVSIYITFRCDFIFYYNQIIN